MEQPFDHHYLAQFHLSRWAGQDGLVCRLLRVHGGQVKAKRVTPKGTAFEPGLYGVRDAPVEHAQAMERDFMKPLDTMAAEALALLEQGLPDQEWTSRPRSAWSRYLLAQLLRSPEDIAQLKASVREDWSRATPRMAEVYAQGRTPDIPETVGEYLRLQSARQTDEAALHVARKLMNHPRIGQMINNMHWRVLTFSEDVDPLLISDRPVWKTASLTELDAFITMPIGPRKLFVAAPQHATTQRLAARAEDEMVAARNLSTIQHAVRFVYGVDDRALSLAQEHLAARRHSTLLEQIAAGRGYEVVDPASPMARVADAQF